MSLRSAAAEAFQPLGLLQLAFDVLALGYVPRDDDDTPCQRS
jgi:hypothetical protein